MTAKKTAKKTEEREQEQNFEKSLKRLETIVSEMESGALGLEEMISRFEEGQSLLKFCSKKLNEVERKIEILVKKGDKVVTEPFEESASAEDTVEEGDVDEGQDTKEVELF